jgi:hypothetical protein
MFLARIRDDWYAGRMAARPNQSSRPGVLTSKEKHPPSLAGAQADGQSVHGEVPDLTPGPSSRRRLNLVFWLLIVVPVLLGLCFTHLYGVNVFYLDQQDGLLPLFPKWDAGSLSIADFWRQHNEHRHFLPRLFMFGLAFLTHWNTVVEMYIIQGLLAVSLAIYLCVALKSCRGKNTSWPLVAIPWLVFSWRQNQNFQWGWQIGFVLACVASVSALFFLEGLKIPGRPALKYTSALVCATVASFSSAQGLMVWPVGLLMLLVVSETQRRRPVWVAGWGCLGAIEWMAYFRHYTEPATQPPLTFSLKFFAVILGASLFPTERMAGICGFTLLAVVAALCLVAFKRRKWVEYSFWFALILLGLLILGQITLARSALGPAQPLASRYATNSLLVVIGVYAILCAMFAEGSMAFTALWLGLSSLIVFGVFVSFIEGGHAAMKRKEYLKYQTYLYFTADSQPDELLELPNGVRVPETRAALDFLKKRRWNLFADARATERYLIPDKILPVLPQSARGEISHFAYDKKSGRLMVNGWATDVEGTGMVGGVILEIDGRPYPACYGLRLDDATRNQKDIRVVNSGFARVFSVRALGKGEHLLDVKVLTRDRSAFFASPAPATFRLDE